MTEKNKVALIDAGAMGGAIGTRLVETGNHLTVFDLDAEKVAALTSLGAESARTAAEAAAVSDVVILSLNSPKIVRIAVFGKDGAAAGAKPGTLIIDMSSIDPEATKELAADAADKGLRWVDSPLSGGAPKALIGQLTLMACWQREGCGRCPPRAAACGQQLHPYGPLRRRADDQAHQSGSLRPELPCGGGSNAACAGSAASMPPKFRRR